MTAQFLHMHTPDMSVAFPLYIWGVGMWSLSVPRGLYSSFLSWSPHSKYFYPFWTLCLKKSELCSKVTIHASVWWSLTKLTQIEDAFLLCFRHKDCILLIHLTQYMPGVWTQQPHVIAVCCVKVRHLWEKEQLRSELSLGAALRGNSSSNNDSHKRAERCCWLIRALTSHFRCLKLPQFHHAQIREPKASAAAGLLPRDHYSEAQAVKLLIGSLSGLCF